MDVEPEIVLVAAVDRDGAIGDGEDVPWEYPEDVDQYRERVEGNPVIIGRRTFDLIRDPPGDPVVVVTHDDTRRSTDPRITFTTDPGRAIEVAVDGRPDADREPDPGHDRVFVIGGEGIYRLYVPYATDAYVSEIPERSGGDAYFPYLGAGWGIAETIPYESFELQRYRNHVPSPISELGVGIEDR